MTIFLVGIGVFFGTTFLMAAFIGRERKASPRTLYSWRGSGKGQKFKLKFNRDGLAPELRWPGGKISTALSGNSLHAKRDALNSGTSYKAWLTDVAPPSLSFYLNTLNIDANSRDGIIANSLLGKDLLDAIAGDLTIRVEGGRLDVEYGPLKMNSRSSSLLKRVKEITFAGAKMCMSKTEREVLQALLENVRDNNHRMESLRILVEEFGKSEEAQQAKIIFRNALLDDVRRIPSNEESFGALKNLIREYGSSLQATRAKEHVNQSLDAGLNYTLAMLGDIDADQRLDRIIENKIGSQNESWRLKAATARLVNATIEDLVRLQPHWPRQGYADLLKKVLASSDERRESVLLACLKVNVLSANELIIKDLGETGSKKAFLALKEYRETNGIATPFIDALDVAIGQLDSRYASSARGSISLVEESESKGQVSLTQNERGRLSQKKQKLS